MIGGLIGLSGRLIGIGKLIQDERSQAVTGRRKLQGLFPRFNGILVAFGLKESLCKLYLWRSAPEAVPLCSEMNFCRSGISFSQSAAVPLPSAGSLDTSIP